MLFSVIIPIYNVEEYLGRCLDSIKAQTFQDFELILVDDGSTDSCPAICDEYVKNDSRARVIHKPNGGLISARNTGLFASHGDYILYIDGDDWAKPDMLSFIHDRLAESPVRLDMVVFAADEIYEDHVGEINNRLPEGYYDKERMQKDIYPYLFSDRRHGFHQGEVIYAHTWDKACRRELVLEHYARNEKIRMFTDVAYVYECLLYADQIYVCNEHLYNYNKTNVTSITAGKRTYLKENFTILVSYLKERLSGYSPSIDRQLNDYPALLIIYDAIAAAPTEQSLHKAAGSFRKKLDDCGLLKQVSLTGGLPLKPWLFIAFLKLHFDHLALLLAKSK